MSKKKRYRVVSRQKLPAAVDRRQRTRFLYKYENIELDPRRRLVRCGGHLIRLTRREAALLAMLLAAPGQAFTRAELLAGAWGVRGPLRTRTVDMHVRLLRKKLGEYQHISTVYKYGYRWEQ